MKFSEQFGFEYSEDDHDFYNTYLRADTKLFVDPFLIYEDPNTEWQSAHEYLLKFFEMAFGLIAEAKGEPTSLAWKKVENLLLFPEPAEFCLGVAEGSPMGSGSGKGLRTDVLSGMS